jgi:hypothetical protein
MTMTNTMTKVMTKAMTTATTVSVDDSECADWIGYCTVHVGRAVSPPRCRGDGVQSGRVVCPHACLWVGGRGVGEGVGESGGLRRQPNRRRVS